MYPSTPSPILGHGRGPVGSAKNSLANNNFNFPFGVNLWFSSDGLDEEEDVKKIVCGESVAGFTVKGKAKARRHPFIHTNRTSAALLSSTLYVRPTNPTTTTTTSMEHPVFSLFASRVQLYFYKLVESAN